MNNRKENAIKGKSIQIDPSFPYYQGRSAESIADELELAGYKSVHYFITNENNVNPQLITALQNRGIAVWGLVLGNGTYSTERFPPEWPKWQMELLKPVNDGYIRFSLFSEEYVSWKKETVANLVKEHPFDGIEIAEPYFPEWNGISRGVYGDVGPLAKQAFKAAYGREIPDFTNEKSKNYYLSNKTLYSKWVNFRVKAVNDFLDEVINGTGGIRESRPDILVATWSLAIDAGKDSNKLLKEYQGLYAPSMVAQVKPDIHFFQTHWPDWMKLSLAPGYITHYQSFYNELKKKFPSLPIGIQTDIGSLPLMVRSKNWLNQFSNQSIKLGYNTWTAYEYHLGGYMYSEKPVPLKAVLDKSSAKITISFNKRIDPKSTSISNTFFIEKKGRAVALPLQEVLVDGNRVKITLKQPVASSFTLRVNKLKDTPELWWFKDYKQNESPNGARVIVQHDQ
ncbi:N-acyl-D-glucosamine 2-epimerase [Bacillus sp. M6-12]|nr:N-acyl-D-glucosamine 2-epimerase [Bacillus sp. M6-12]